MFEKALKQEKRSTMVYYREKMVDRDALCPINVCYSSIKYKVFYTTINFLLLFY